jgi:hypothetical protein
MTETVPTSPKWSADRALCANGTDVHTSSTPISKEDIERIENAKRKVAAQLF